jgi:hypothetical protein
MFMTPSNHVRISGMASQRSVLYEQALQVLRQRYAWPVAAEQELVQRVYATADPAASALAARSQCRFGDADAADCLLMLEVLAIELHHNRGSRE